MPLRMSGLVSNFDTESMVKELMSAQNIKLTSLQNKKTKNSWTVEKWEALNTKLYSLYRDYAGKMKMQATYQTKKTTSSDETKVTATASSTAPNGAQTIQVDKLATTQYITGAKLGDDVTGKTKLTDTALGLTANTTITIKNGTKTSDFTVTGDSTVNDFVSALNGAGLTANFDSSQKRLFIAAKNSGENSAFSITSSTSGDISSEGYNRTQIRNAVNYSTLSSSDQQKVDDAMNTFKTAPESSTEYTTAKTTLENFIKSASEKNNKTNATNYAKTYATMEVLNSDAFKDKVSAKKTEYITKYQTDNSLDPSTMTSDQLAAQSTWVDKQMTKWSNNDLAKYVSDEVSAKMTSYGTVDAPGVAIQGSNTIADFYHNGVTDGNVSGLTYTSDPVFDTVIQTFAMKTFDDAKSKVTTTDTLANFDTGYESTWAPSLLTSFRSSTESVDDGSILNSLGLANITSDKKINGTTIAPNASTNASVSGDMTVVWAQDSKATINGAELTGNSNELTANGVTYSLKGTTTGTVTINVSNDTQGVYDTIKDFISGYNSVLKEMNTLYYAGSSKGYEPLTDDEKSAMSDSQIEKWETKIKDSLLRRDSTLDGLITSVKSAMQTSVTYTDGKSYSLLSFGITTSTDWSEKGLLHIYGDEDDSTYADEKDKLMKAINEDPDKVMTVFTGVADKLYKNLVKKMSSTTLSSAQKFYNDKYMKNLGDDYDKKIKTMNNKLSDMENNYYKKFSAMETALAKLQQQQNSLSNLIGQ